MFGDPRIHQQIAGAGVETKRWLADGQISHIGDAADVEDDAMDVWVAEHLVVKGRNQWRALTACRDIARTEVTHYMDTCQFSEQGGVVQLDRIAMLRTVADGLPVAADGLHLHCTYPCLFQKTLRRIGIFTCELIGDELCLMQLIVRRLVQREQCILQWLRIRLILAGDEAGCRL